MRSARLADYWRALDGVPLKSVPLEKITFANLAGLEDAEIVFQSPVTAICGINGTGKSAILRVLWATLDKDAETKIPAIKPRLGSATATLQLRTSAGEVQREIRSQADLPEGVFVEHLDPSALAATLQEKICVLENLEDPSLKEFLEAYEALELDDKALKWISYILKRSYQKILVYEIDEFEIPFPFILINDGSRNYNIRTASLGEISILLIFWTLHRALEGTIVLLEEPETYLSPVAQSALMDYLAFLAISKKLTIVLTTHSPPMFSRLKSKQVRFVFHSETAGKIASEQQFSSMRKSVGLETPVDCIMFVEDRAGAHFLRLILGKLDYLLSLRCEIIVAGDESSITRALDSLPRSIKSIKAVGVYDGDMRNGVTVLEEGWPAVFLPGDRPVEQMYRDAVGGRIPELSKLTGRSNGELEVILANIRGQDHHDWFENFAKELRLTYEALMHVLFELWYSSEENETAAVAFIALVNEAAKVT